MPHAGGARKRLACRSRRSPRRPTPALLCGKYEFGGQNLNSTVNGLINAENPR
jgi:hypothetical protein